MEAVDKLDDWVARLKGESEERDLAIAELRTLLVRGLAKSLSAKYGANVHPEDVVQEALVKILASLDQFEGRSRFTTWAMTIATRIGISELRRRHYKDVSLDAMTMGSDLTFEFAAAKDESTDAPLERDKLLATLKQLIENELTEKQRGAVRALLDGVPVEEIARKTGSNRNAVYKLIHDARLRLRDGFAAAGIAVDDVTSILS